MRTGTCARCGDPFVDTTKPGNRRFCSDNCRKRHGDETTGRGVCIDCGGPMGPRTKGCALRCVECGHAERHRQHHARRLRITELWNKGWQLPQIAADLDSTVGSIGVEMVRMRGDGWDLPHRRPYYGNGRDRVAA